MSDKHKDIEELFKDAASNAGGPPPPPADWGAMSSLLQESALIQTGAGAAKVGILKALGTKAMMLKVVAGTVIVGGGLTGSYVLLKEEPAQIAANTIDQSVHPENTSIDQTNTIGYNDHLSQEHSSNTNTAGATRGTSSSSLNVHEEGSNPAATLNDGRSSQLQETGQGRITSDEYRSTIPQGEQTTEQAPTSSGSMHSTTGSITSPIQPTSGNTPKEIVGSTKGGEIPSENTIAVNQGSAGSSKSSSETIDPATSAVENTAQSLEEAVNQLNPGSPASNPIREEDLANNSSPGSTKEADAVLLASKSTTNQTNTNTSISPENTVDADQGTPISANSNTNPSASTGNTTEGSSDLASQNALPTTATPEDGNTDITSNLRNGDVVTHLTLAEQGESTGATSPDASGNEMDARNNNDQELSQDSDVALNTSEQSLDNKITSDNAAILDETSEGLNPSTSTEDPESIEQLAHDAFHQPADTSAIKDMAFEDSTEQLTNEENALLAQADSLLAISDSATLQPGNITMRPDEPKWLISPYFSIDRSNYTIDQFTLNNLAGSTKDLQIGSNGATFSAGIRGAYNIAPYLWLESGFLYSKKSGIQGIMELYDDNNEVTALANYQLTGDFYEIPLALGVRSNNGYFGWYFKAGVNLTYNRASASSFFEYYDFNVEKVYTIKPSFQTLNPAITASAGFEYNILPQLRFYAEPNFRFSTRPVLNTSEFDQIPLNPKWSTMGLGIGINYYLGKK